ncbi:MAG: NAD(P)/FAD-dependent oxidoreductase [Peptococcaceae bacterium]|nr:NAD(P)/FAD-dependent oxidoreductase [Peptococcaceae bacterium]
MNKEQEQKDVIVIGGGAAGIFAAIAAAEAGASVTIWEKNNRLGKKMMITGKGRCNITNAGTIQDIIKNMTGNGKFLYSALNQLDNEAVMVYFEEIGVPVKVERGRRVFPVSDKASDVVEALERELKRLQVKICYERSAKELLVENGCIKGLKDQTGQITTCSCVILATGGNTYPATGSTGDGYVMAEKVGHTITALLPSLVPLETKETWVADCAGLSLKNAALTVYQGEKKIDQGFGEMLFTHWGISGPVVLSFSRSVCKCLRQHPEQIVTIEINLKPALDKEQLDKRVIRDFTKFSRKNFSNSLNELLPQSLIPIIIKLSGIEPTRETNAIRKEERERLVDLLQHLTLQVSGVRPITEAIVTAGGVSVKEVNPKTMASKVVEGLFFAGEVLDIDGYTGGYNLQAAFSTGHCAGTAAAAYFRGDGAN